jgi:archaellum component FlaF (FlaF/FlaG flagellin family)
VTVTDANGCTKQATVTITQPSALTVGTSQVNVLCNGASTGTATAIPSGGTPAYTYSWNTVPVQTTATATGLAAGSYTVTVTDANGCTKQATVTITQPSALTLETSQVNVLCNGASTGTATAIPSGGTPTYTYSWNTVPVQTTATATGLGAGSYTVTVTDANGCTKSASVTITQPDALTVETSQVNVLCNGASTGTATAIPGGGTPAYTYSWNTVPVQTTATATGLAAGSYTVTVTDANGCTKSANVTITEPAALHIEISQTNVLCNGGSTGSATATVTGGTGSYTYSWNTVPVQTTATATGLAAGSYTVTVTDENGCTKTAEVTITQPDVIVVNITGTGTDCSNVTGSATVTSVTGGVGPYTYLWSPGGQTTPSITGLGEGTYTVTVTDANGCTKTASYTVVKPPCQGCSPGFWKNHTQLWSSLSNPIVNNMPAGLRFTSSTKFFVYFGIAPGSCGFPNNANMTMQQAISMGGGNCTAFSRHAISALLSSAAGLDIPYPSGTTNFTSLYNAIKTALQNCNCSGTLFTQLEYISSLDGPFCSALNQLAVTVQATGRLPDENIARTIESNEALKIAPNPATSNVRFSFTPKVSGKSRVTVQDINGKIVAEVYNGLTIEGVTYYVNMETWKYPGGVYFVHFLNGAKDVTEKLIISH